MEANSQLTPHPEKIALESLFDNEIAAEDSRTLVFQQVLARVHKRIKLASRNWKQGRFCFYVIPELIVGVPRYNVVECTKYLVATLESNGFMVRYTYPNLLFISWEHYLNSRDRERIRKATGQKVDGYGRVLAPPQESAPASSGPSQNPSQSTASRPPPSVYDIDLLLKTR